MAGEPDSSIADEGVAAATMDAVALAGKIGAAVSRVAPMPGGRNNRVFRVDTEDGAAYLLKRYFHHPSDSRDRLRAESAFLGHLSAIGCDLAPRLFATNRETRAALMEFVRGESIAVESITSDDVDWACEFFRHANVDLRAPTARALAPASEACFSIDDHLATTQRRIDRLGSILVEDDVDEEAREFAIGEILPVWSEVRRRVTAECGSDAARSATLTETERCLSPSDFGFHNALREPGGRVRFLDFEYAGWDDPAKLLCDFANQPDVLLPRALSERFRDAVLASARNVESLRARVEQLEPLYQVKWACICLNDFLAVGRSRRRFTLGERSDDRQRRIFQLGRARKMLARTSAIEPSP